MGFKHNNKKAWFFFPFLLFDIGMVVVICHRTIYHILLCYILVCIKIPACFCGSDIKCGGLDSHLAQPPTPV